MNVIQIGKEFEEEAKEFINMSGFDIVEHTSKINFNSHYDFIISKNNEEYYLEVRGRRTGKSQNYFSFSKRKLNYLKNLDKPVLIMLINNSGFSLIKLEDIELYKKLVVYKERKIYICNVKNKIQNVRKSIINPKNIKNYMPLSKLKHLKKIEELKNKLTDEWKVIRNLIKYKGEHYRVKVFLMELENEGYAESKEIGDRECWRKKQ